MISLLVGVVATTSLTLRATRAEKDALTAQANETKLRVHAENNRRTADRLRQQADVDALAARRHAYASDRNAARQTLAEDNLARALTLLKRQIPSGPCHRPCGHPTSPLQNP